MTLPPRQRRGSEYGQQQHSEHSAQCQVNAGRREAAMQPFLPKEKRERGPQDKFGRAHRQHCEVYEHRGQRRF